MGRRRYTTGIGRFGAAEDTAMVAKLDGMAVLVAGIVWLTASTAWG